jgi:hypothetical protein
MFGVRRSTFGVRRSAFDAAMPQVVDYRLGSEGARDTSPGLHLASDDMSRQQAALAAKLSALYE